MRRLTSTVAVLAAGIGLTLLAPGTAYAATVSVTNCNGSGVGSLPDAVAGAPAGDTITFDPTLSCPPSTPITLTSTLIITRDLTITGPGPTAMAVSGGGHVVVLNIVRGPTVDISGLTIEKANSGGTGGGIFNAGSLSLTNSTVTDNSALRGGGIFNNGTVILTDSTISGNTSGIEGGGIYNHGTMALTDSTISGNSSSFGGGILNGGALGLTGSTVSGNSAGNVGGGIYNSAAGGIVNAAGSIVAGNTAAAGNPNCLGSLTSVGYNLTDDSSGTDCGFTATGDVVNADPQLGALADNGGPTLTMLPAAGSPAAGAIPPGTTLKGASVCPRTDQRGVASVPGGNCTIGAVEVPACPAAPSGDGMVSADQASASATFTAPALTTSSGADLLLAFVEADGPKAPTQTVSTVTGAGLSWSLAARANQSWGSTEVWQAFASAPLSAVKVKAKLASAFDGSITVAAFHSAAAQVGAIGTGAGTSGSPTATLTPQACGSLIWAAGHDWTHAVTPLAVPGQSLVHSFIDRGVHDAFWTQKLNDPTTGTSPVTVTTSGPVNDRWTMAAVEIRAAS